MNACCGFHQAGQCDSDGAAASLAIGSTITGGTASRLLFAGAGAVLDDDSALTWDDTDKQLSPGAGTVGKPSLIFTDDTTGFFRPAADQLAAALAGVLALRLGGAGGAGFPDSDQSFHWGRAVIDSRATDNVNLSHRDKLGVNDYLFQVNSNGAARMNAPSGQAIGLYNNGTARWLLDGTAFDFSPTDNLYDLGQTARRVRRSFLAEYMEMSEVAAPAAPGADKARLFVRDNGSSKSQLCVIFPTGAIQVIATEP